MSKITIFFGDINSDLVTVATNFDKTALFINKDNYTKFLNNELPTNTFYTSLGDLANFNVAKFILNKADDIYYCPPTVWSDNKVVDCLDVSGSIQGNTEYLLFNFYNLKNNVHNLDLSKYSSHSDYSKLVDCRRGELPQLWIAGGSDTHGTGVRENERYGEILANKLNLPVSFLTDVGSSIRWIADQIIRSDIRADDIVVVGTVPAHRFSCWSSSENKVCHITPSFDQFKKIDLTSGVVKNLLVTNHRDYENFIHIQQIINHCHKIKAKLFLLGLKTKPDLLIQLHNIPEFKNYINMSINQDIKGLIDEGTDTMYPHPGIQQHQLYADFCYQQLKNLNYI